MFIVYTVVCGVRMVLISDAICHEDLYHIYMPGPNEDFND